MKKLTSLEMYQEEIKNGTTVVMFSAGWCKDCVVIEPILPEIEQAYEQINFIHADRDQFIDLCQELDVFGIPSFIAFRDGVEIERFVSKDRKTKEEIEAFLDKVIS